MAHKTKLQLTFLFVIALMMSVLASVLMFSAGVAQSAVNGTAKSSVPSVFLSDGRLLSVGGAGAVSGEARISDAAGGNSVLLKDGLRFARSGHTATVLPDGRVLILGGVGTDGNLVRQAEIFDPTQQQFQPLPQGSLTPRVAHSATLLTDGQLLVVGGRDAQGSVIAQAELWNSRTGKSETLAADALAERAGHEARLLSDGRVYVVGGASTSTGQADGAIFDPVQRRFGYVDNATPLDPAVDSGAAFLSGSTPLFSANDVPVDATIALRFSKPLDMASLSERTVTLSGPAGVTTARVVAAEGGMLAFLAPQGQLFPGSIYSVFVSGARERNGTALPFTAFRFNTVTLSGNAPGTNAPGTGSSSGGGAPNKSDKPGTPSTPTTGIPKPTPPIGAGQRAGVVKPPVLPQAKPKDKKPAVDVVDDEDWTPDARHRNGKWRTARHAPYQLKDSVKEMRRAYREGGTALSGQVLRLNGQPLANVNLSIGTAQTRTDGTGRFILNGLTPGRQEMVIDGRRDASGTARPYGYYVAGVDLKPGTLNELRYTIWMPKIRAKDMVRIASPTTQETVVTHPDLPGLELRIPPGAVIRDREGKIVTEFAITPVPVDQAPFPVPENFPMYFVISPGGAVIQGLDPKTSQGIRVVYPNYLNAAPGTEARFWNFDARDRDWFIYGKGKVSADGTQVVPDPGVALYDWMVFGYGIFNPGKDGPEPVPPPCEGDSGPATDGDPVDCFTGLFVHARTDVVLKDVMSVALRRVYRPGDTVVRPFGYGTSHQYAMYLQAPLINGVRSADTMDLILSNGARIRYRLVAGTPATPGYWEHTESASRFYKSQLYQSSTLHNWEIKMRDGSFFNFSAHGLYLTGVRDRYGNFIEITESAGNITRLTTQNGRYVDIYNDTSSRIQEIRDFEGRSVLYQYDPTSGMLTRVTYPDGTYEQYGYDTAGRMTTVRDRRGNTMVTNEYDANGRVRKQTLADSSVYLFAYVADAVGRVLQTDVTDPRGYVRRVRFDHPSGYPTSETYALGTPYQNTTTTERDPASGRAVLVTDALNRKTRYTYDPAGNVATITYLDGTAKAVTESYTWTSDFQELATYTDPLNHTTTLNYDTLGNLTSVVDPLQQVTQVNMDGQGRLRLVYDTGTYRVLLLNYDQADLRSIYDSGRTTTFQPDAAGRVVAVVNPAGEQTRYQYDLNDRVRGIVDPQGGLTQLVFDALGNLQQVIDPKNTATTFVYDGRNRLWAKIHPAGPYEVFGYDGRNNLISHYDRYARTTTYNYDPLNRVQTITRPDNTATILGYDPGNRLRSLTENPANPVAAVTRTYDDLDRLETETSVAGTVTYTYDAAGNRRTRTAPGQASVTYDYDNADRPRTITQGSSVARLDYDSASRRTKLSLPNGIDVVYRYNAQGLTGIDYLNGATTLGNLTYGYDPAGRINNIGGSFAATGLPPVISASHGIDHRLNTQNTDSFTYDAAGNIQTRTDACGTTTYTWNVEGELTQIGGFTPTCQALAANFSYDALGRRQSKTINGITTTFLYDGYTPIQERQGATTTNLLTGPGIDEYLARSDGSTTRYFLPNHLGSTLALTDPAGTITTRYTYSPFGETTQTGEASSNPFQYTGRENDNTGLYYYRARYYDPKIQRFVSSDPIGLAGGLNTYAYVDNNPIGYIDPYGLYRCVGGASCDFTPPMQSALQCFDTCTGRDTAITGGRGNRSSPNSEHARGEACDVGRNANPDLPRDTTERCTLQCFSNGYGQEEGNGPNIPGTHFHLQLNTVPGGIPGFAPGIRGYQP
jgi:RHS repeat-associated protein